MEHEVIRNYSATLILQAVVIMLFMFPDFSFILWKSVMKKWSLFQGKQFLKRTRKTEEKLKKYWEIDMRKFK